MGHLESKKSFRKEITRKKTLLDPKVFYLRDNRVTEKAFLLLDRLQFNVIHCYLPMDRKREPSTYSIIKRLKNQAKQVVVSSSDFTTIEMSHYLYDQDLQLKENSYGIPEPVKGNSADISAVDLIFVPLLTADRFGNRIGYGKGFYDRLLAQMENKVLKIGLCIGPLFDEFPFVEAHDIKLNYCITPFETVKYDR